jgi:molybdate transport system substrate-binding protein
MLYNLQIVFRSPRRALRRLPIATMAMVFPLSITLGACGGSSDSQNRSPQILVAAASNLRPAFEDLAWQFTDETSIEVVFTFGASGQLREQVLNGAPFDVFAPADPSFTTEIIDQGLATQESEVEYAIGRLALWSAPNVETPADITQLADSQFERIAIANPEIAPYGLAAVQSLTATGVLPTAQNKLVYGESISDTKQIIDSGNAPVGIIALSLAIADGRPYVTIPESLHEPLVQTIVNVATSDRTEFAQRWIDYLSSPAGVSVLEKYGFARP